MLRSRLAGKPGRLIECVASHHGLGMKEPVTPHHWLSLAACLGHLGLFALTVWRGWRSPLALLLGLLAIDLFAWNAADVAEDLSANLAWDWLDAVAASLAMPLGFHFVLAFTGRVRGGRLWIIASYAFFSTLALGNLAPFLWAEAASFADSNTWRLLVMVGVLVEVPVCAFLLWKHHRSALQKIERWRTLLVLLALLSGTVVGSTDLWGPFGVHVKLGNIGSLMSAGCLATAGLRLRLFGTGTRFHLLLSIGIASLLLLMYVGIFVSTEKSAVTLLTSLTLALVLAVIAASFAGAASEQRSHARYLATLGRFSAQMAHDLKNPLAATQG